MNTPESTAPGADSPRVPLYIAVSGIFVTRRVLMKVPVGAEIPHKETIQIPFLTIYATLPENGDSTGFTITFPFKLLLFEFDSIPKKNNLLRHWSRFVQHITSGHYRH